MQNVRRLLFPTGSAIFGMLLFVASCSNDAPPMASAVHQRDSLPLMTTYGVSKLISDSGVIRYKIIAEEWKMYDKTRPPRQTFMKGIFLEKFDDKFHVELYVTADTAYCYNQNLWKLRGRVYIRNQKDSKNFSGEELYWDMGKHLFYSYMPVHFITPESDLRGSRFYCNEQMTEYGVNASRGFFPLSSQGSSTPNDSTPAHEQPVKTAKKVQ